MTEEQYAYPTSIFDYLSGPSAAGRRDVRNRVPRRLLDGLIGVTDKMPKSPTCANCGRPMDETPRSLRHDGKWEISTFHCETRGLDFLTEDHVPLTGEVMSEPRKRLDPIYCSAKEAEFRKRSTDEGLTPESRASFLSMAATWATLAKESDPQSSK